MSSPLILSFNMNDTARMDRAWPIITNKAVIAVNQRWAGSPGRRISLSSNGLQVWAKPMGGESYAIFMMNTGVELLTASLPLQNVSAVFNGGVCMQDLYRGRPLPSLRAGVPLVATLPAHDSEMYCAWPTDAQGACDRPAANDCP